MPFIQLHTAIPGPKSQALLDRRSDATPAGLAKSTSIVPVSAKGALVQDLDGNQLIDLAGGIGMLNVGHSPRNIVNAIKKQADSFIHTCALVTTYEPYVQLCEMLNELAPGDWKKKTLLANAGGEAVENAVNIAKYYTKRPSIIVFEGAYHGRTHLTASLTSKYNLFKKGYGATVPDIVRLPAPNMYRIPMGMNEKTYLEYCIAQIDHAFIAQVDPTAVAAILIEPILGEGGFIPMPKEFLAKLRAVCDQHGIVLIFDEIQCGMGRTGKLFCSENYGIHPDLVTVAKSLGAGTPISALIGRAEIMDTPHLGAVGGTYGGSPLSCVAAIESLKMLTDPAFIKHGEEIGEQIRKTLESWKKKYALIGDVRGVGAMRLLEFVKDRKTKEPDADLTLEIIRDATTKGVILIRAGLFSNCIRLLPPMVITKVQLKEGLEVLEGAIQRAHEKRGIV
jgi:4-aminobutyrate aminotransferase / (S)-3-amino-2-methylpropionate transaminase / 5-aminovalerate transaminase